MREYARKPGKTCRDWRSAFLRSASGWSRRGPSNFGMSWVPRGARTSWATSITARTRTPTPQHLTDAGSAAADRFASAGTPDGQRVSVSVTIDAWTVKLGGLLRAEGRPLLAHLDR
ncbi:unnamed protein product [Ectocarpus sp. 12 AP-2014]